ncbi:MAG: DUF6817 domain-containing protein [Frankia sp.]
MREWRSGQAACLAGATSVSRSNPVRGRTPVSAGRGNRRPPRWGLCHAVYRTAGFRRALLEPSRRADFTRLVGPEAEELVYRYGGADERALRGPPLDE